MLIPSHHRTLPGDLAEYHYVPLLQSGVFLGGLTPGRTPGPESHPESGVRCQGQYARAMVKFNWFKLQALLGFHTAGGLYGARLG